MALNFKEVTTSSLKRALRANAVFSGFSGALIVLAEARVVGWLGLDGLSIWPVGAMLLLFSVYLFWLTTRRTVRPLDVRSVIWSDWAWVLGTAALLLVWTALSV